MSCHEPAASSDCATVGGVEPQRLEPGRRHRPAPAGLDFVMLHGTQPLNRLSPHGSVQQRLGFDGEAAKGIFAKRLFGGLACHSCQDKEERPAQLQGGAVRHTGRVS